MASLGCQLGWIEMPRKLVQHTRGRLCEGVSRDDWHMGQGAAWGRPALNVGSAIP